MEKVFKGIQTIAFHPSCYLDDFLEERNITFWDLIDGEEISTNKMKKFMNGKIGVDSEIAYLLSKKLGTSINLWINLQKRYKRKVIKAKKELKRGY